jgi:glycosyltransferase involved in cell wall biosynthesis
MTGDPTTHAETQRDVSPSRAVSLLMVATVWNTVSRFLVPYASHFRAIGWRVDAAVSDAARDPGLFEAFDHIYDLPLSRSLRDVRGLERGRRALGDILETRPDIVHVHTPIAGFLARLAVRRTDVEHRPAIAYTAHGFHFHEGGNPATNAAFRAAERLAGRWTDRLVVINDEDEAAAIRQRIVPRRRLVRMPGIGLDTKMYSPSAVTLDDVSRVRSQLGIAADAPIFAIVGELTPNKRHRDSIAALASMRHSGAHLVFAGDGRERSALETQARDLGVEDQVHLLGVINDVRPIVRAAIAVILPSAREGLARSVMEALSLEVPVIASTARGNRELVGQDSGLLFDIGDVGALADRMDSMIDRPDERQAMGRRGRERMVGHYDLSVLLRLHETMYREMLAERSRWRR